MKKIFVLLCAAALMTVACEKEEPTPTPENPTTPSDTTQVDPFTTVFIPNAVTDYDGNSYDAVQIGSQVWMASNLRTTHYANGDAIPVGTSTTDVGRYAPDNNEAIVSTYGYLYNWPAVMHGAESSDANPSGVQGVCPNGWHMPSDAEWTQLTDYCAAHTECVCSESKIAKSLAANHDWCAESETECAVGNDLSSNNATGFKALPAGMYGGGCFNFSYATDFWSATQAGSSWAYSRSFYYDSPNVFRNSDGSGFSYGFSVRCVRDIER